MKMCKQIDAFYKRTLFVLTLMKGDKGVEIIKK